MDQSNETDRISSQEEFGILSLQQKAMLRSYEFQVKRMTLEQAQTCLVVMYEQMLIQETVYKELLAKEWGINQLPSLG